MVDSRTSFFLLKMSRMIAIPAAVQTLMAFSAERDEVVLCVVTQCTSVFQVVNVEILGEPTYLTSPTIALKHLPAKPLVGLSVQVKPALSRDARSHDACGIRSRNSCRREFGSSRYILLSAKRRESASPAASRLAPARKSAQIISRQ